MYSSLLLKCRCQSKRTVVEFTASASFNSRIYGNLKKIIHIICSNYNSGMSLCLPRNTDNQKHKRKKKSIQTLFKYFFMRCVAKVHDNFVHDIFQTLIFSSWHCLHSNKRRTKHKYRKVSKSYYVQIFHSDAIKKVEVADAYFALNSTCIDNAKSRK